MTTSRVMAILVTIAALAVSVAALWSVVPAPLIKRNAEIAALRGDILKLERQRARLGDLERWTSARDTALQARSRFLLKGNASPAAAQLQSVMRSAASNTDVAIISAQDYSAGGDSAGVRMNVAGDLNMIADFLIALDEAEPRLIINELSVRRHGGDARAGDLNVTIAVSALYWSEAAN